MGPKKSPNWKAKSSCKPPFWGSMLNFPGCTGSPRFSGVNPGCDDGNWLCKPIMFWGKRVVTWEATWRIIPWGLGYLVNHHGDQKSPKDRVEGPFLNGQKIWWLLTFTNHLLIGMILQVPDGLGLPATTVWQAGVLFLSWWAFMSKGWPIFPTQWNEKLLKSWALTSY